jgi:hypothetical protein
MRNLGDGPRIFLYWDRLYKGISDANTIITRSENVQFDSEEQRLSILANAYFHRAFRYYRLVHQFGDIPLIVSEVATPRFDFYSTQRRVTLRHIKDDLDRVVDVLPAVTNRGMVNQGAVLHLLTKVNLALGEFDDAIASATKLINGGTHSLMENRFGINANDPNRNIIWDLHRSENKRIPANREVIYIVLDEPGVSGVSTPVGLETMRNATPFWMATGQIQTPVTNINVALDNNQNPYLAELGRGIGTLRNTWYHQRLIWGLDNTDLRRDTTSRNWVDMENIRINNPALRGTEWYGQPLDKNVLIVNDTIRSWFGWPHYKINVPEHRVNNWRGSNNDWYIFRLAATYLLRAEAYYWTNRPDLAAADINRIRVRAGARPIAAAEVDMRMIIDERARELFYEEARKTELTRIAYLYAQTGRTTYLGTTYTLERFSESNFWFDHIMKVTDFYNQDVRTAMGNYYTMAPFHILWPIPEEAIAANMQGRINQNVGYAGTEYNIPPIDHPNR